MKIILVCLTLVLSSHVFAQFNSYEYFYNMAKRDVGTVFEMIEYDQAFEDSRLYDPFGDLNGIRYVDLPYDRDGDYREVVLFHKYDMTLNTVYELLSTPQNQFFDEDNYPFFREMFKVEFNADGNVSSMIFDYQDKITLDVSYNEGNKSITELFYYGSLLRGKNIITFRESDYTQPVLLEAFSCVNSSVDGGCNEWSLEEYFEVVYRELDYKQVAVRVNEFDEERVLRAYSTIFHTFKPLRIQRYLSPDAPFFSYSYSSNSTSFTEQEYDSRDGSVRKSRTYTRDPFSFDSFHLLTVDYNDYYQPIASIRSKEASTFFNKITETYIDTEENEASVVISEIKSDEKGRIIETLKEGKYESCYYVVSDNVYVRICDGLPYSELEEIIQERRNINRRAEVTVMLSK